MFSFQIWLLVEGGGHEKNNIYMGIDQKGGLGQLADLRRGLAKKRGGVFERGLIPQCTLE